MRWYRHRYHTPLWHRVVFTVIPRVPRALHPPIAAVTAAIFFALLRRERRAVAANLRQVTGRGRPHSWCLAFKVFYSFCDFVVSYCYVPQADDDVLLAMLRAPDGAAAAIRRALAQGRGLVVWTAHLGNWEFASRLLERHGRPVNVARVVERDNPAEAMLRDLMTNDRSRIVDLLEPLASVRLFHALRNNEIVAVQGDRAHGGAVVHVPFFGRPAPFPAGPFLLARLAGAPVLPSVVVRDGWLRYRVVAGEPITVDQEDPAGTAVRRALEEALGFLAVALREYPGQWMNFYEVWPETEGREVDDRGTTREAARHA